MNSDLKIKKEFTKNQLTTETISNKLCSKNLKTIFQNLKNM